jgi:hydrogenase-4 membrane subunit HyfE
LEERVTGLLIAFELVLLVPLFIGSWRTSLLGLSCQGFLMAWVAFHDGPHVSFEALLEFVDLVVLRAVAAPTILYAVLHRQDSPRRNDVIAPNLLSWGIALALILMAFRLADALVPLEGDAQTLVAVSASALVLGLLVLSTRTGPFSQMVGALRIENAIALFELGDARHSSVGVRIAQSVVLLCSLLLFRWYLVHLSTEADAPASPEAPAL